MQQWKSVDEILDFAIGQEQQSFDFYTDLSAHMVRPWMSGIFKSFAQEELGHKRKLEEIKSGNRLLPYQSKVLDLKIGDYLVDVEPSKDMDYQQALVVAMMKEKKAFKMYNDLAASTEDTNLQEVFMSLAQEEAKHKLRFEIEYDDYIMKDN